MVNNTSSNSINIKKMYFQCLNLYVSTSTADLRKEESTHISHISLARKAYSELLIRYVVTRVLDANEFGFTYLVKRVNKNKQYIIKEFFPAEYAKRNDKNEMILRIPLEVEELIQFNYMKTFFMGEVDILEKISKNPHKNIVKIDAVERNKNNTTYIIYEYETGITLQQYIQNKRDKNEIFTNEEIFEILNPLLDAVEHLHTLEIPHLNIAPENILIRDNKSIVLMGFEGSKLFKDEDSHIFCHAYTPQYAAPEQVDINYFSQIGKSSDIYAIGGLLYLMVSKELPLRVHERISCKKKHEDYDPYVYLQKKSELLDKYDISLLASIDKALMFSSKDRFKSILAFQTVLKGKKVPEVKPLVENKRNWLLYAFIVFVGLLLFLGWNYFNKSDKVVSHKIEENITNIQESDSHILSKSEDSTDTIEKHSNVEENVHVSDTKDTADFEGSISEKRLDSDTNASLSEDDNLWEMNNESEKIKEIVKKEKKEEIPVSTKDTSKVDSKGVISEKKLDSDTNASLSKDDNLWESNKESEKIKEIVKKEEILASPEQVVIVEKNVSSGEVEDEIYFESIPNITIDNTRKIKSIVNKQPKSTIEKNKNISKIKSIKNIKMREKVKVLNRKKKVKVRSNTRKKTVKKTNSGYVWYCKAFSGNIKTSAKYSNKNTSKQAALQKCRQKLGKQKNCRILNCFLIR